MRRLLFVLVLTVMTVAGAQQDPQPATLVDSYELDDTLVVGARDTLRLGPGANFTGSGRIETWGTLIATGSDDAWVELGVPVDVRGNGTASFVKTRFWGASQAALAVQGGAADLEDVLFVSNAVGLTLGDGARVVGRTITFVDHHATALRLTGPASLALEDAHFRANLLGLQVVAGSDDFDVAVRGSAFVDNGQHVLVDLGTTAGAESKLHVQNASFGKTMDGGTGVRIRSGLLEPPREAAGRTLTFQDVALRDMTRAFESSGSGFQAHLVQASFVDNEEAIRAYRTDLSLENVTFEANAVEITADDTSRLRLVDVTHQTPPAAEASIVSTPVASRPWWPPLLGIGLVLGLAGGWMFFGRTARRAQPSTEALPAATAPPEAQDDPFHPFSQTERTILLDVIKHPGSSQQAIASRLGLTRQALHYHVKKLATRGAIVKVAAGRETHCTVNEALAERLAKHADGSRDAH